MKTATRGWLQLDGWQGRTQQEVEVVGETATKVRVRALTCTRLAGRRRSLEPGQTALVPRHAVRNEKANNAEVIQ